MGFKDIGSKVEEAKGKIDEALAKTDIDEKILANKDDIKKNVGSILDKTDLDEKIKNRAEKLLSGKKEDGADKA
ncbi:MAG: hypothetical protein J6Z74_01135 [Eubacterium sp.]|nr:hypothetical protein [Eubacterium sp.]